MLEAPLKAAHSAEPIAGYRLRNRIGAGGYGEVWSAEAPGELVKAIKFVFGQMDETRAARELKALNLIKGVRHPFLLSLERIEVVDGQLLIVTELADGSLKDEFEKYVKEGLPGVPRTELLEHLADAADALDYMNSQHSLQHLDVKPENLLLVGRRIKVADFGLVKDVQETTCSMMGGLTPIYAPPEVFDARPSRWSDQYSLAIVFQEMLTGVLPFPGKTAAQLAAQHLSAKPRLSALPEFDQPIIARALAKDPTQRFASCKEMISALLHADAYGSRPPAAVPHSGASSPQSTAVFGPSIQSGQATAIPGEMERHAATEQTMFGRLDAAQHAASLAAQGDYAQAEQVALTAARAGEEDNADPAGVLVDLPPPDGFVPALNEQPVLVLGIGGLAGKTLQQFRRRIDDRCDAAAREMFSFLLLDTDPRELMETTHGHLGSPIHSEETVAIPLRKSADYRNDSRKYLDWLSRRWLFNIPKSQLTEGIRPFGRLAFVDHGDQVMARLDAAVATVAKAAARVNAAPRVIIVGSSSGGASSGMVLDVVFAIRQILDGRAAKGTVELLLLHGTGRQPAAQELAAVNTFALLSELNHYMRPGGVYPGETACGLKSRPASSPTMAHAYLADIGHDLTTEGFVEGCDRVAEFLYLETASTAHGCLVACRSSGAATEPRRAFSLRSFGLCQIGFSRELVWSGTKALCRAVIGRWSGEAKIETRPSAPNLRKLTELGASGTSNNGPNNLDAQRDAQAAEHARELGINLDNLAQRLIVMAGEELGSDPGDFFQKVIKEGGAAPGSALPHEKWLAHAAALFGVRSPEGEPFASAPLAVALSRRLPQIINPLGTNVRDWLLALPEDPQVRVHGAGRCTKWFQSHLKSVTQQAKDSREQLGAQLDLIEHKLAVGLKGLPKGAAKDPANLPEALFFQHCQIRLYQLAGHLAAQVLHGIAGFVAQANDKVFDLSRDVKFLASQFPADPESDSDADLWEEQGREQLRQDEETSATQIDEQFQKTLFGPKGFAETILQGGETRTSLLTRLKQEARRHVLAALGKVDLTAAFDRSQSGNAGGGSRLAALVATAQPWLQRAGGERRLICVAPQGKSEVGPSALINLGESQLFGEKPAVITAPASQLVICYELGSVPVPQAAACVIDHRPECAEAATRLHARSDVSWHELRAH